MPTCRITRYCVNSRVNAALKRRAAISTPHHSTPLRNSPDRTLNTTLLVGDQKQLADGLPWLPRMTLALLVVIWMLQLERLLPW